LAHLADVFRRLNDFGLKANLKKCQFARKQVTYLGYDISNGSVAISAKKREACEGIKKPTTKAELMSFIALAQYYSQFIPEWSALVRPLRDLLNNGDIKNWLPVHDRTFEKIKELLIRDPKENKDSLLMMPDPNKQYVLDTDASRYAIGAVLQQYDQDGNLRPIMFISRKLNDAEKNYCTRQREALAVVWAFKRLREYLWGSFHIIVRTDHQNLVWLMTNDYTGRLARWQAILSCYDFEVKYMPGKKNVIADTLSRCLWSYTTPSAALTALQQMEETKVWKGDPDAKNTAPANMVLFVRKIHDGSSPYE